MNIDDIHRLDEADKAHTKDISEIWRKLAEIGMKLDMLIGIHKWGAGIVGSIIVVVVGAYLVNHLPKPPPASSSAASGAPMPLPPTYPVLPRADLTPGSVRTTDISIIASTRTSTVRNVPQSEKDAVYREYGIDPRRHEPCEIDHLISLELGGDNSVKNLWPELYAGEYGAHTKDKLENHLHSLVVAGVVPVTEAQHAIATDWVAAYKKYMPVSATRQ